MKESVLGAYVVSKLKAEKLQAMKLHGTKFQRGLPDYLIWGRDVPLLGAELKVASTFLEALDLLSGHQRSVLYSMAKSEHGALLIWGNGVECGVAKLWDYDHENAMVLDGSCVFGTPVEYAGLKWRFWKKQEERIEIGKLVHGMINRRDM